MVSLKLLFHGAKIQKLLEKNNIIEETLT